jgi:copper(I)-binding protein
MRYLPLLLAFLPTFVLAAPTVHDAWAPPSLSQPNGVAFLTLTADRDDRLTEVRSDCCAAVEIHTHEMDGDVMLMRRVKDGVTVKKGETITFQPGGLHVMLIGLKAPLNDGDTLPLTLRFASGEDVATTAAVSRQRLREQLQHNAHGAHGAHH